VCRIPDALYSVPVATRSVTWPRAISHDPARESSCDVQPEPDEPQNQLNLPGPRTSGPRIQEVMTAKQVDVEDHKRQGCRSSPVQIELAEDAATYQAIISRISRCYELYLKGIGPGSVFLAFMLS
jgi:hypothetical protein